MSEHADVAELAARVAAQQASLDEAKAELDDAIRAALAAGVPVTELAEKSGLSRPRIYQIRDRRR
ncbi:hypothetical protein [Zhihengliuella halotolerans]|uniref:hypothetical protein n=1 Tax=Zhihengliuella halotolerans TaxID=370736 RepID=UPI000C80185A|nr:hypothetical protein [Zhihengliuella halotolerans]